MRVFVTGAAGGIGSVLVPELMAAGSEVLAWPDPMLRREYSPTPEPQCSGGDLDESESLRAGAVQSDWVIHLAFGTDFNNFENSVARETSAVETFGAALDGSGRALVIASGTPALPGHTSTEVDPFLTDEPTGGRGRNARAVIDLAERSRWGVWISAERIACSGRVIAP